MGDEQVQKLLKRLDAAWLAFLESYAGLPDERLMEPGVTGDWSVKDVLAHVTTWEEEALKHLPLIIAGGKPPRYVTYRWAGRIQCADDRAESQPVVGRGAQAAG